MVLRKLEKGNTQGYASAVLRGSAIGEYPGEFPGEYPGYAYAGSDNRGIPGGTPTTNYYTRAKSQTLSNH